MKLIGRKIQQETFHNLAQSTESKLVAVIGRRRIGKTFLVRKYYRDTFAFEITGLLNGNLKDQLENFTSCLIKQGLKIASLARPTSWIEAFQLLELHLAQIKHKRKKVIFLDELPWMDTPRSKFIMAFENFWNSYCTKRNDIICVVCGSAASWMIKKIVNNRGGLHNRISEVIRLKPFSLRETEAFLKEKGIRWSRYDIIQLQLVLGGVPYYLDLIRKGESFTQFIDRVCFKKEGNLYDEYNKLFSSLFAENSDHQKVVEILSKKKIGMTRKELISHSSFKSGGTLTQILLELEESTFIESMVPYSYKKSKSQYKLTDSFSIFYHKFMVVKGKRNKSTWSKIVRSPSWISWSGFAYERLCFSHIIQIKKALNIEAIESEASTWSISNQDQGAQIDMVIDRTDRVVNVCEIKFSQNTYTIDKEYAKNLRNKLHSFSLLPDNKKKTLFLTMIAPFGVKENPYYHELVQNVIEMDAMFE